MIEPAASLTTGKFRMQHRNKVGSWPVTALRGGSHSAWARSAILTRASLEARNMRQAAKMLSRIVGRDVDIEELKVVAIFCGVGLLISLLAMMSLNLAFQAEFF